MTEKHTITVQWQKKVPFYHNYSFCLLVGVSLVEYTDQVNEKTETGIWSIIRCDCMKQINMLFVVYLQGVRRRIQKANWVLQSGREKRKGSTAGTRSKVSKGKATPRVEIGRSNCNCIIIMEWY